MTLGKEGTNGNRINSLEQGQDFVRAFTKHGHTEIEWAMSLVFWLKGAAHCIIQQYGSNVLLRK